MAILRAPGGVAFMLLLVLAPAALGSNRPLPWAYNAIWAAAALGLIVIAEFISAGRRGPVARAPIGAAASLFLLTAAWAWFQTLSVSGSIFPTPIWDYAASAGVERGGAISIAPHDTLWRLMRLLTVGAAFLAAYFLGRNERWATAIIRAILVAACIYALYGLMQVSLDLDKVLWFDRGTGRLTSTFVSPNNAATLFGLASVIALALVIREFRHTLAEAIHHRGRHRVSAIIAALPGRLGLELVLFFIVFVALLLTASRGGILFTIAALLALVGLQSFRRMPGSAGVQIAGVLIALFAVTLLLVVFQMSGAPLLTRILEGGLASEGRVQAFQTGFQILQDNWLLGTGYGTFEEIFPLYREDSSSLNLVWDKAHNDYLELFIGLGIFGGLALLLSILVLFANTLRGFFVRRRNTHFAAVAVGASILVGLHSLVDFSLQIEAVALTYAALLGVGVAQSQTDRV